MIPFFFCFYQYNIIYLNLWVLCILKYLQNCNENVPVLPGVLLIVILGLTLNKSRGGKSSINTSNSTNIRLINTSNSTNDIRMFVGTEYARWYKYSVQENNRTVNKLKTGAR